MTVFAETLRFERDYGFDCEKVVAGWERLHGFDGEPLPSAQRLRDWCAASPAVAASSAGFNGDHEAWAQALLEAWVVFHNGDFAEAFQRGRALGFPGYGLAHIAACAYTDAVTLPKDVLASFFRDCAARSGEAALAMPRHPNAVFYQGLHLGRYSETISLVKAAAENVAGKFVKSLQDTLALYPDHVLAHLGYGSYHASVVSAVGSMVARLTWGASRDKAIEHFERAHALAPHLPATHLEFGKGLAMLKDKGAKKWFASGAALVPADAMEELDVRMCRGLVGKG
jgi:hypothetical protein